MPFFPLKSVPIADFKVAKIGASQTMAVGDAIIAGGTGHNQAVLTGASITTTPILGIIVAIVGLNGNVLELQSVTTGSGNETTPVHFVQYIPTSVKQMEYAATLSAVAGTTTGSDGMGYFNMYSTAGKLDEASIAFIQGTAGQFWSFGLDVTDNTNFTVIGVWNKAIS